MVIVSTCYEDPELAVVRHVISFATLADKPQTSRLYISGDCSSRILDDKICVKMDRVQSNIQYLINGAWERRVERWGLGRVLPESLFWIVTLHVLYIADLFLVISPQSIGSKLNSNKLETANKKKCWVVSFLNFCEWDGRYKSQGSEITNISALNFLSLGKLNFTVGTYPLPRKYSAVSCKVSIQTFL